MSNWNRIGSTPEKIPSSAQRLNPMHGSYPVMQPLPKVTSGQIPTDKRSKEHIHRFAGLAVGLASVVSEHVLSHPCIVLRRQCQVHNSSRWSHLTPFTLFPTIFNIQRHQSMTTLWKGIGSSLMVKGIAVASEAAIHEFTPLPREVNRHSSLKKMAEHIVLKGLSLIIVTPFYAASLVETVQSEIACERPGVFDCIVEGFGRLASFTSSQPTRLLPIWKLLIPTVLYGIAHYVISSLAMYKVKLSMKANLLDENKDVDEPVDGTIYELYYPELVATFTGNLLADTMLYPWETVLHRLFLQGTRTIIDNTDTGLEVVPITTRYEGAFDCYSTIVSEEGFSGLYKGFGALILQYGLHIAILKLTRSLFEFMSADTSTTINNSAYDGRADLRQRDVRDDPLHDVRQRGIRDDPLYDVRQRGVRDDPLNDREAFGGSSRYSHGRGASFKHES